MNEEPSIRGRNDFEAGLPPIPTAPSPPSLPVRITREVAVPIVASLYVGMLSFLRFYDKITEASYVALVGVPVGGYLGSLVPKLNQDKNR